MDVELSGFDVLAIAEKIERNGAAFYRRAAGLIDDSAISTLFANLAEWESRHIEVFRQMAERLSNPRQRQGDRVAQRVGSPEASVMASLAVFGIRPDPADELTGHESKLQVLRMALDKEKDSIVYYVGLKDFVAEKADKDLIDQVIEEEKKHVRILMQSLEQVG